MARINFVYDIKVSADVPKLALLSLKTAMSMLDTSFLQEKATPKLKKVLIDVADIPTRVIYDPLTMLITVNPSRQGFRHKTQGLVPNALFALSMAYYDSLKTADRLYWRNLTRREKVDRQFLSKISFHSDQTGKNRLLFASELTKYFLMGKERSPIIVRFFENSVDSLVTLSPTRFRGLIQNRDRGEEIRISQSLGGGTTVTLAEALDITGITGITDALRGQGLKFDFDYDETGLFIFNARNKEGKKLVQIKRSFHFGEVQNDYFAIDPSLQRQGLGLKVFATQLMSAVKNGIPAITLTADRDEEAGLFGYNVWWRFGFDGHIDSQQTGDPEEASEWWQQAVVEKILGSSEMDLKLRFYGMIKRLREKVSVGEFSPAAFQYFLDRTLDGDYVSKEDFQNPSKKDFLSLVQFFNRISPDSPFLRDEGFSFKFQTIQRLFELDGFGDWWKDFGVKWRARLDLSDGEDSPSIAILRDYMADRGV